VSSSTSISRFRRRHGQPVGDLVQRASVVAADPFEADVDAPCRAQDALAFMDRIEVLPGQRLVGGGALQQLQGCRSGRGPSGNRCRPAGPGAGPGSTAGPRRMAASSPARIPPWSEMAV
jgi:hypothetical protein